MIDILGPVTAAAHGGCVECDPRDDRGDDICIFELGGFKLRLCRRHLAALNTDICRALGAPLPRAFDDEMRSAALHKLSVHDESIPTLQATLRAAYDGDDPQLPSWLANALARRLHCEQRRAMLIDFAELIAWPAKLVKWPDLEPLVVTGLMLQAETLRDNRPHGYDRSLAVALRTVARIAPPETADALAKFLRSCDPPRTKHAALVAVKILFSATPSTMEHPALWERLAALLEAYLNYEHCESVEIQALTVNTFLAAAACALPQLDTFTSRAPRALAPLVRQQLANELHALHSSWLPHSTKTAAAQRAQTAICALGD